jgi:hypothetical protein
MVGSFVVPTRLQTHAYAHSQETLTYHLIIQLT